MDILLVSGRSCDGQPHRSEAAAQRLVDELNQLGHETRWLRAHGTAPPFRAVQARVNDQALEIDLTKQLRARLPDVVHVLAHGEGSSTQCAWLCERLGAPAVVRCDAREVLCHRGSLVHASGVECREFDDPARCAACCGLKRRTQGEFANRIDLAVGGLTAADLVLVPSPAQRDLLLATGLAPRRLRVLPEPDEIQALLAIYREIGSARTR